MGDENTTLSTGEIRHLLRRTGFGALEKEVARFEKKYNTRGAAADRLLTFNPSRFRPGGKNLRDRQAKWFKYMLRGKRGLQEKLVLFLHDHFATNNRTVGDPLLMANQNRLLRQNCKGNFRQLVKDMCLDPALAKFLDTTKNDKEQPNENFARELLELFTCGVTDFQGNANYEQEDVSQIARAFTGWRYDKKEGLVLREYRHDFAADFPERGPKVIFKIRGGFGSGGRSFTSQGEGENEFQEVVDAVFAHRDSEGKSTVARRIAGRLLEYFAHGGFAQPSPESMAVIDGVIAESGFDTNWDLHSLLRSILISDAFFETAIPGPSSAATLRSVRWPIDFAVTSMRLLGIKPKGRDARIAGGSNNRIVQHLENMGQELFDPPSVFGWDWENSWITSRTVLARATLVRDLTVADQGAATAFRPQKLIDLDLTEPGAIVDAVTDVLDIQDRLSSQERDILIAYLTDQGAQPVIDLTDERFFNVKLRGLFAIAMQSPTFQLH